MNKRPMWRRVLCRLGWHHFGKWVDFGYYEARQCRGCGHAQNATVWDGWNP